MAIAAATGCNASHRPARKPFNTAALAQPNQAPKSASADHRAALVGQTIITWDTLTPALAEAVGGEVLEEQALGVLIARELAQRRLHIDDFALQYERKLLGSALVRAAGAPESEGESLVAQVRARRGLGDIRFRSLLERNAGLRLLVRRDPALAESISDSDLRAAYAIKFGERLRTRIIVVPTLQQAAEARRRLETEPFAEVAGQLSIDRSRALGGLLEPISVDDPAYPAGFRAALAEMEPGAASEPIGLTWDGRDAFAIVRVEERLPAPADAPTPDQARADLVEEVRLVRERRAMDALGRRLLSSHPPTVLDRSLGWSWDAWRERTAAQP